MENGTPDFEILKVRKFPDVMSPKEHPSSGGRIRVETEWSIIQKAKTIKTYKVTLDFKI